VQDIVEVSKFNRLLRASRDIRCVAGTQMENPMEDMLFKVLQKTDSSPSGSFTDAVGHAQYFELYCSFGIKDYSAA
jgi:hypothetical protein